MSRPTTQRTRRRRAVTAARAWALLACLAWAVGGPAARAEDAPEDALAAAHAALSAGRLEQACEAFRGLLEQALAQPAPDPARVATLRRGLGTALIALQQPFEALDALEPLARDGTPSDAVLYAEALVGHARAAAAEGSGTRIAPYLDDALAALARAEGVATLQAQRLRLVGEAHLLAGRPEEAVRAWSAVPWSDPPTEGERWTWGRLARTLYDLGRFQASAQAYERLGELRGAAAAWAAAREPDKALALYAAHLASGATDAALLEDAVAAARYAGGGERLEALLEGVSATGAGAVNVLRARARLAEHRADHARAVELLRTALAAPEGRDDVGLGIDLVRVLLRVSGGDPQAPRQEAFQTLMGAFKVHPDDARLKEVLLALAQQDLSQAWQAYPDGRPLERSVAAQRALLAQQPDDALAWANLANTLRVQGEIHPALTAFAEALRLAPDDATIRNDYGLCLKAAGRAADAEAEFQRALSSDPSLLAAWQNLARAHARAAREDQARQALEQAVRAARTAGAPWMLYRALSDRAWRASHRPDRR